MRLQITLFLCLSLTAIRLSGQNPAGATLATNRVKAQFNTNGALFTDFQQGQFIAPYAPGQPEISLLRAAGLWVAGMDMAGNLSGAVQLYNTDGKSDYKPGPLNEYGQPFPDNPLTDIYRVTGAEIAIHLADLADNGVIDNPQSGVFGWPGRGNPFFELYHNGEALPNTQQGLAGFYDRDQNGNYDPDQGDYPTIEVRGCPLQRFPTDMLWFVFNDVTTHPESGMSPLNMEIQCQAFAFDCTDESPLRNSLFVRYKMINWSLEPKQDMYFGLFNDFDIGNAADDFFGCDPARSLVFGYNGDTNDEGSYGTNIPVLAMDLFRGPLDTLGEEIPLAHVIPFNPATTNTPVQYYNLLRGLLPDGTPAPNNGLFYPGNPNDPGAGSETGAGNIPGERRVVASYGPMTLLPGAVNEIIAGYFFTQEPGNTPLQNVQAMYGRSDAIQAFFDHCFGTSDAISCSAVVDAPAAPEAPALQIFPNPADQLLTIASGDAGITRVQLTDMAGRPAYRQFMAGTVSQVNIPVSQLPAGVYFAEIWLEGGAKGWERVVVSR